MIELEVKKALYEYEACGDDGAGNCEFKHKIQVKEISVADRVLESHIDKILCWHHDEHKM